MSLLVCDHTMSSMHHLSNVTLNPILTRQFIQRIDIYNIIYLIYEY